MGKSYIGVKELAQDKLVSGTIGFLPYGFNLSIDFRT